MGAGDCPKLLWLAVACAALVGYGCGDDVGGWFGGDAALVVTGMSAEVIDRGSAETIILDGRGFSELATVYTSPTGASPTWTPLAGVTWVSGARLDLTAASLPPGTYSVRIDNGDGEEIVLTDCLTVLATWGVSPAVIVEPALGVFPVFRVTGEGFAPGAAVFVSPDGTTWTPTFTTFLSAADLDFRPLTLPADTYSVKVDNGGGEEWTFTDAITALPRPRITSITPDFGPAQGGTFVTVTGDGFDDTCVVMLGYTNPEPLAEHTVVDAHTITGRAPPYVLAIPQGNVAGIPTAAAATQTFTVEATEGATTVSRDFTIEVVTLRIAPAELPAGVEGESYYQVLTAQGGFSPYTWSVGAGLPAGLTLDASGVLSGTPGAAGTYTFTVTATDWTTPVARSQDRTYTMDVLASGVYLLGGTFDGGSGRYVLPDAAEGSFYGYSLPALGGTPPYTFSIAWDTADPGWLALDPGTGDLWSAGPVPPGAAVHDFTVTVTDSLAAFASRQYRLEVVGAGSGLRIASESLSAAIVDLAYEEQIETAGGNQANVTFSITAGRIPEGLHLNARIVPYWVEATVAGTDLLEGPWMGYTYVWGPSVIAVMPGAGDWQGGTSVTILGSNFPAAPRVFFGSSEATGVVVIGGNTITCTTARHCPPGLVDVRVVNPVNGEVGELQRAFTYTGPKAPAALSVSPAAGPAAGGTAVTVTGDHFELTPEVYLGGTLTGTLTFDGTVSVVGAGTWFLTEVGAGDYVAVASPTAMTGIWRQVQSVAGDTQLTLVTAYPGAANSVEAAVGAPLTGVTVSMQSAPLTGVVDVAAGGTTVTGTGTSFGPEVAPGDFVRVGAGGWVKVESVESDTSLTLAAPYGGAAEMGATGYVSPDDTLAGTTSARPAGACDVWIVNPSGVFGRGIGLYEYE